MSFISKFFNIISLFLVLPYLIILLFNHWLAMRTILKTELKTLAVNFYLCCISLQWKAVKHLHNKICFSKLKKWRVLNSVVKRKILFIFHGCETKKKLPDWWCKTRFFMVIQNFFLFVPDAWQDEKHPSFRLVKWKTFLNCSLCMYTGS